MVIRRLRDFIDDLDNRRIDKEYKGGKGTIYLKNLEEFEKVSEYFKGQLVSPGGAAGHLGVSRAMIHQLERDGKIRAYRFVVESEDWENYSFHLKLLLPRKSLTIWIPIEDLNKYAQTVRKRQKD
jgi:hypothetical protein